MTKIKRVASYLPARARQATYTTLATAIALEAVWGVIPEQVEAKLISTLSVLGFGMAVFNTED